MRQRTSTLAHRRRTGGRPLPPPHPRQGALFSRHRVVEALHPAQPDVFSLYFLVATGVLSPPGCTAPEQTATGRPPRRVTVARSHALPRTSARDRARQGVGPIRSWEVLKGRVSSCPPRRWRGCCGRVPGQTPPRSTPSPTIPTNMQACRLQTPSALPDDGRGEKHLPVAGTHLSQTLYVSCSCSRARGRTWRRGAADVHDCRRGSGCRLRRRRDLAMGVRRWLRIGVAAMGRECRPRHGHGRWHRTGTSAEVATRLRGSLQALSASQTTMQ